MENIYFLLIFFLQCIFYIIGKHPAGNFYGFSGRIKVDLSRTYKIRVHEGTKQQAYCAYKPHFCRTYKIRFPAHRYLVNCNTKDKKINERLYLMVFYRL